MMSQILVRKYINHKMVIFFSSVYHKKIEDKSVGSTVRLSSKPDSTINYVEQTGNFFSLPLFL